MADTMILPGVYIDVLSEGLIAPGQVTVGNLGVVGTAAKGTLDQPMLLSSYNDALAIFGSYDSFRDPTDSTKLRQNSTDPNVAHPPLTLVRALELAFGSGATTVYAMRVADATAVKAALANLGPQSPPPSGGSTPPANPWCVVLTANSPGAWGNEITVNVTDPDATDVLMAHDSARFPTPSPASPGARASQDGKQVALTLKAADSGRNRVVVRHLDGTVSPLTVVPPSAQTAAGGAPPSGTGTGGAPPSGTGTGGAPPSGTGTGGAPPSGTGTGGAPPPGTGTGGAPPSGTGTGGAPPPGTGTGGAPSQLKDGEAQFNGNTLLLGTALKDGDVLTADYRVDPSAPPQFVKVTVALGTTKETYLATDGKTLAAQINDPQNRSALVTASPGDQQNKPPDIKTQALTAGANGEAFSAWSPETFDPLLDVDAHIIVAAGQSNTTAGAALDAHCQKASTDVYKRDRIAVVGCDFSHGGIQPPNPTQIVDFGDKLIGNTLASDRVVFVAPGIIAASAAAEDQAVNPITLPGSYSAAVVAGMLAASPPHISLTNKPVAVADLEVQFNTPQLTELVQNRVTAVENNRGFRVLRGQTTDIGAFREITTRRIVDYAKYGVRAAAQPFIGELNDDRVRSALRTTIDSFLGGMVAGEMLIGYSLEVSATRAQQIAGIVPVTMTLQPTFSINFIQVTMILS